jgi:hypothetical protein
MPRKSRKIFLKHPRWAKLRDLKRHTDWNLRTCGDWGLLVARGQQRAHLVIQSIRRAQQESRRGCKKCMSRASRSIWLIQWITRRTSLCLLLLYLEIHCTKWLCPLACHPASDTVHAASGLCPKQTPRNHNQLQQRAKSLNLNLKSLYHSFSYCLNGFSVLLSLLALDSKFWESPIAFLSLCTSHQLCSNPWSYIEGSKNQINLILAAQIKHANSLTEVGL